MPQLVKHLPFKHENLRWAAQNLVKSWAQGCAPGSSNTTGGRDRWIRGCSLFSLPSLFGMDRDQWEMLFQITGGRCLRTDPWGWFLTFACTHVGACIHTHVLLHINTHSIINQNLKILKPKSASQEGTFILVSVIHSKTMLCLKGRERWFWPMLMLRPGVICWVVHRYVAGHRQGQD